MIDRSTVVQILLESRRGIENADAIAAIDGVDLLAVGLNDLSADLDCLGEFKIANCAPLPSSGRRRRATWETSPSLAECRTLLHYAALLGMDLHPSYLPELTRISSVRG